MQRANEKGAAMAPFLFLGDRHVCTSSARDGDGVPDAEQRQQFSQPAPHDQSFVQLTVAPVVSVAVTGVVSTGGVTTVSSGSVNAPETALPMIAPLLS